MPQPICPKCKNGVCARVKREGWFQTEILPRFGYFPWECSTCRKVSMIKKRGQKKRKSSSEGENLQETAQQSRSSSKHPYGSRSGSSHGADQIRH